MTKGKTKGKKICEIWLKSRGNINADNMPRHFADHDDKAFLKSFNNSNLHLMKNFLENYSVIGSNCCQINTFLSITKQKPLISKETRSL